MLKKLLSKALIPLMVLSFATTAVAGVMTYYQDDKTLYEDSTVVFTNTTRGASMAGKTYTFNGTDAYVEINDADKYDVTTDFMLMAWIKPVGTGLDYAIISKGLGGGPVVPYMFHALYNSGNPLLKFQVYNDGGWSDVNIKTASGTIDYSGVWQHVAVRVASNGVDVTMYINGSPSALIEDELDKDIAITTTKVRVGSYSGYSTFFDGEIARPRIIDCSSVDCDAELAKEYAIASQFKGQTNVIENGRFANWTTDDPDDWTVSPESGAYYVTQDGNAARIVTDGTFFQIVQSGVQDTSKQYIVEFDILEVGSGQLRITNDVGANSFNSVGHHELIYTPSSADFGFKRGSGVTDITFTNITVQELKGKPTGGDTIINDGNMEAVGTTAYTATGSATLSKDTTSPHRGSQNLKITNVGGVQGGIQQVGVIQNGHSYRCYGYAHGDGGDGLPFIYFSSATRWTGTNSTEWQYFDFTMTSSADTYFGLFHKNPQVGAYIMADDIRCEDITP